MVMERLPPGTVSIPDNNTTLERISNLLNKHHGGGGIPPGLVVCAKTLFHPTGALPAAQNRRAITPGGRAGRNNIINLLHWRCSSGPFRIPRFIDGGTRLPRTRHWDLVVPPLGLTFDTFHPSPRAQCARPLYITLDSSPCQLHPASEKGSEKKGLP